MAQSPNIDLVIDDNVSCTQAANIANTHAMTIREYLQGHQGGPISPETGATLHPAEEWHQEIQAYATSSLALHKKAVDHASTYKLFLEYEKQHTFPHWLELHKEQKLSIKDCPIDLKVKWDDIQREACNKLLQLLIQHHSDLIQSLEDTAQSESTKLLAKISKSSLSSEVKKSLVSLIEAKETDIGLTLKQYVQGANSKLANKMKKLVEQNEKDFRDLPSSEDMELEGPSHPILSPKNIAPPSKEHLLTEKVESLIARLDTLVGKGKGRFHPYQREGNGRGRGQRRGRGRGRF